MCRRRNKENKVAAWHPIPPLANNRNRSIAIIPHHFDLISRISISPPYAMTYLPPEILAQVLEYFSPSSTERWRRPRLAPLATLNRSWQNAVEAILWAKTEINITELPVLQSRITNKTACRRRNLRYLKVTWYNLFPHKDRENHSAQERFEAFLEQEYSFYTSLISLWEELVSWGTDLNVSKIAIGLINAGSVYEMLGPRFGVRNSPAFDAVWSKFSRRTTYIQNLPHLPTVKRLVVHASHRIDLWPAIMAVSIAASLPNLDSLAIADHDLAKWWPRARKQLRDGNTTSLLLHSS